MVLEGHRPDFAQDLHQEHIKHKQKIKKRRKEDVKQEGCD